MGGNIWEETRRIDAAEFKEVSENILNHYQKVNPLVKATVVPAYRNKASFGDIDIIMESNPKINPRDLIESSKIHKNGNVYSYQYPVPDDGTVQVDLITQKPENYETSINYYSYNDLGNICGRVAHRLGFKLGHEGLSLVLRDDTYQFACIMVSKEYSTILRFLGYDSAAFFAGFDELVDIFAYAASSPFFNKNIYAYENRNHISRTRDKKRLSYRGFLDYINTRSGLPSYPYESMSELGGRVIKTEFLERAYQFFPDLKEKYDVAMLDHEKHNIFKTKFNGSLVSALTSLTGKELGGLMTQLRKEMGSDQLNWVLEHSESEIKEIILTVHAGNAMLVK